MGVFLRRRWRRPPSAPVELDPKCNLLRSIMPDAFLIPGSSLLRDIYTGTLYTLGSTAPSLAAGGGVDGIGCQFTNDDSNSYIQINSDADNVLGATECTMLVVRSLNSISFTTQKTSYGYRASGTDLSSVHFPYIDGNVYWDFGNNTAGSGRVSAATSGAWTVGKMDAFAFVAGATKGREIWRNGQKIAGDAAAAATRSGTIEPFYVGASSSGGGGLGAPHDEVLFEFFLVREAWDDARIQDWSENPWQLCRPQMQRSYFMSPTTAAAANAPIYFVDPLIFGAAL